MNRLANVFVALCLAAGLTACGGGYSGFIIPIESELNPWVAPEADEFATDTAEAGGDDDYEDYEDEEGGEEPAPAPSVPAQPAVK